MALIGPSPTVASVSSLVRSASEPQLVEIFDEVIQFTDGPILVNLAANSTTRPKLVNYMTSERLMANFEQLKSHSDPQFTALSWLADETETLRKTILECISKLPMPKASLTIFARLFSRQKLYPKDLSNECLKEMLNWLHVVYPVNENNKDDAHWQNLADVIVKGSATSHQSTITEFVKDNMSESSKNFDAAFAVIRTTCDVLPTIVENVWCLTSPNASNDFFFMLSALCNSKDNRDKVMSNFGEIVSTESEKGNTIAQIVDAKILAGTTSQNGDIAKAAERLDKLSQSFEKNIDEISLEGLACTVSLASVRNRIAEQGIKSPVFMKSIVKLLKENPTSTAYAVLAILVRLARFPMKPTKEEDKQTKLRTQALGKTVFDVDNDVEDESRKFKARQESTKICDQIITTSLVSWATNNAPKLSRAAHEQLAYLVRELATHQEKDRRESLAIQGAVIISMYLWALESPKRLSEQIRSVAASTISKILSTVVPQIALTEKVAKSIVVAPLCSQIHNEHSDRPNLETFEALRALTNLASIDDNRLRLVLSRQVWQKMTDALNSEFLQIRRASLELICNLMTVPNSAERFLQTTSESKALLSLLGRSIIVDDEDSRLAAAGALAILSEWETAGEIIGHNNDCVEGLTKALGLFPEDDPLLLRVLTALNTIIKATTAEMDDEVVERIVFNEGLVHLEMLVDTLDTITHHEVAQLVLQCIKLIAEYKRKNTLSV